MVELIGRIPVKASAILLRNYLPFFNQATCWFSNEGFRNLELDLKYSANFVIGLQNLNRIFYNL